MEKLIEEITTYFINANQPMGFWTGVVTYVVPIVGSIILVGSAFAGVKKYYKENKRIYAEKMLTEVYAPLFMYLVKQEYLRERDFSELTPENVPLFSAETTKRIITEPTIEDGKFEQKAKYEKEDIINLKDLFKVQERINFGLVPHNLLVLLSICQIKENTERDLSYEQKIAERALKKEIIDGYVKYKEIIGENKNDMKYIDFKSDNITVKIAK